MYFFLFSQKVSEVSSTFNVVFFFLASFFFLSLQTSILCRVGELAGGGSAAVAVSISDR